MVGAQKFAKVIFLLQEEGLLEIWIGHCGKILIFGKKTQIVNSSLCSNTSIWPLALILLLVVVVGGDFEI